MGTEMVISRRSSTGSPVGDEISSDKVFLISIVLFPSSLFFPTPFSTSLRFFSLNRLYFRFPYSRSLFRFQFVLPSVFLMG